MIMIVWFDGSVCPSILTTATSSRGERGERGGGGGGEGSRLSV